VLRIVAYVDDVADGKLINLKEWWNKLNEIGPLLGYFPKALKFHLL